MDILSSIRDLSILQCGFLQFYPQPSGFTGRPEHSSLAKNVPLHMNSAAHFFAFGNYAEDPYNDQSNSSFAVSVVNIL